MGSSPPANYFVTTLGDAQHASLSQPTATIPDLLQEQALNNPNAKAIGFSRPAGGAEEVWEVDTVLTFEEVWQLAKACRTQLKSRLSEAAIERSSVALLSNSTLDFLFNWLGLILLGHPVLLIAPQCTPTAVAGLCSSCNVQVIIHGVAQGGLASQACEQSTRKLQTIQIVRFESLNRRDTQAYEQPKTSPVDVAYLFHTSGTSSGQPKPIPQSHHAAVGALPRLDGKQCATFTTTPLYHGGVADLFRAWTSNAMMWCFPEQYAPVTARNVIKALQVASTESENNGVPRVTYFSSVPYVLEPMSGDESRLDILRGMDLVGVGGAPLPRSVGDALVDKGVKLVSRFGSAECGFIMSSHRDYKTDKGWQWLRLTKDTQHIDFVEENSGEERLAELVVRPGWPHIGRTNQEDGSYATADLFERHPSISNAWRYHSRKDAQLTLVTGKKFDPSPIEAAIAAATALIQDVLIFGNDQPYPGALLFRSKESKDLSDAAILEHVKASIISINDHSPAHAKVPLNMLVPMPFTGDTASLPKSSKGTVLRGEAEKQYKKSINQAYAGAEISNAYRIQDENVSDELLKYVKTHFKVSENFDADGEFFAAGLDSVATIRLRKAASDMISKDSSKSLPATIVEDCGTVNQLSKFVINSRHTSSHETQREEVPDMMSMVKRWQVDFSSANETASKSSVSIGAGKTVLLTGVTGSLGAHVLDMCRRDHQVQKIYCLVRGADEEAIHQRVTKALGYRKLTALDHSDQKVVLLQARLGDRNLGLTDETFAKVREEVTLVIHLAWAVNFRINLKSFERDHIAGLQNLLLLVGTSPRARMVFCSSTASVANYEAADSIPEQFIRDENAAPKLGYARSKWVAEAICQHAIEQPAMKDRLVVLRIGQLSGDSEHGIWNETEAWPLLLSTVETIGCLPLLPGQQLDWLPIDVAARALMEVAALDDFGEAPLYHLVNPHDEATWNDLVKWISDQTSVEVLEARIWLDRAQQMDDDHPAKALLDFWKDKWVDGKADTKQARYEVSRMKQTSSEIKRLSALNEQYFDKVWKWIQKPR